MITPTFAQLKKTFLDSGYEIRIFHRHELERLALDAPMQVKRHTDSDIMGLIMPDEYAIGIAKDLSVDERATTLLHEIIHLYDEKLAEDEVEELTLEMEDELSPSQYGFLQFLVA